MNICNSEGVFWDETWDYKLQTIEEFRAFQLKQSDSYASYVRSTFLAPASPYEAASWAIKLADAKAFPAYSEMLAIEADARGITTSDLVTKILGKAQALAQLEALISGVNGKHNDTIKALTDIESVKGYDWRGGYPEA